MADYTNSRTNSLPDPASPGFRDGDTISLQNGSRFSRQNGRWEPIAFQSGSAESPLTVRNSAQGIVGLAPSGTLTAGGALTLGTALDCVYSDGIRLYLPAGAFADATARFVWCVMSSTTAGVAYESAGGPVAVGSGSAYTGESAEVTVATLSLPWSAIDGGRSVEVAVSGVWSNTASAKTVKLKNGVTTCVSSATVSTGLHNSRAVLAHVGGGQVRVYNDGTTGGSGNSANLALTKGADVVLPITLTKVAADYAIIDLVRITAR